MLLPFDKILIGGPGEDILVGGDGIDFLFGRGGADRLQGGAGNDTYLLNASTAAGSQIDDDSGSNDTLNLMGATLSLSLLSEGLIGFGRDSTALVIDLDRDGTIGLANDLLILNFFATTEENDGEDGPDAGTGFIENVGNLSGTDILNLFGGECLERDLLRVCGDLEDTDGDGEFDSAQGTILIGRTDGIDEIIRVENATVELDDQKLKVTDGTVFSAIGNVTAPLFKGDFEVGFDTAVTSLFQETGSLQNDFTLAGLDINFSNLKLDSDGIALDGNFGLPNQLGAFGITLEASKALFIGTNGVRLGGKVTFPDQQFELSDLFTIKSSNATIEYFPVEDKLKIRGELQIETPFFKVVDPENPDATLTLDIFGNNPIDGQENFIEIKDSKVDIRGSISAKNINFAQNWGVSELTVSVIRTDDDNDQDDEVRGTAKVKFPWPSKKAVPPTGELGAGLGFLLPPPELELNFISLEVDGLGIPIGTTGIFWQRVAGSVNNIAETDPDPVEFGGGVGLTFGPEISVPLPDFLGGPVEGSLLRLDIDGTVSSQKLAGQFGLTMIHEALYRAEGGGEYDWNKDIVKANTSVTVLGGVIAGQNNFTADFGNGKFTGFGQVALTVPNHRLFRGFRGKQLTSSSFQTLVTDDNNDSNDYVAAWKQISIPVIGSITAGLQVFFDGNVDVIWGANDVPQTNSFDIDPGAEFLLLTADWDNATNDGVLVRVKDPSGNFVEEVDFAANGIAMVDDLTGSNAKTVVINNPAAGNWDLQIVDETGLGEVRISAFQQSEAPTIEVTTPAIDVSGPKVTIEWNAFDADSDAEISLFYDTDNEGFDGILITDSLAETDGASSFVWNTEGVATGDYFIYAMALDENNAPAFSYSQGRVQITEEADLSVTQTTNADSVGLGNNLTYTITLINNGPEDSKGISLTETLSEEVTFVSASLTPSEQSNNVLTFDLGDLANGASITVDITVVTPTTDGTITSSAFVTSQTFDPNATNDVAILATTISPLIAINDVTLIEGDSGTTNAAFTVSLNAASTQTVTVDYITADDTATTQEDYIATDGTLEFAPGETEKTVTVEVVGDAEVEEDETFLVNLSLASNATIADDQGVGTIQNNEIMGTNGDDILTGTDGDNLLIGRNGNDNLTGGNGSDRFAFNNSAEGIDTITDFESGSIDLIEVSAAGFGGGLTPGTSLNAAQFVLGTTASDGDDRFIYDTSTGDLFFDLDGSGATSQQQIATLTGMPSFGATDIVVV